MNFDCFIWSWFRSACHCTEIAFRPKKQQHKKTKNNLGAFPIRYVFFSFSLLLIQSNKIAFPFSLSLSLPISLLRDICFLYKWLHRQYKWKSHDTVTKVKKKEDKMQPTKVLGERVWGFVQLKPRLLTSLSFFFFSFLFFLSIGCSLRPSTETLVSLHCKWTIISLIIGLNGVHYSPFTIMNILSTARPVDHNRIISCGFQHWIETIYSVHLHSRFLQFLLPIGFLEVLAD